MPAQDQCLTFVESFLSAQRQFEVDEFIFGLNERGLGGEDVAVQDAEARLGVARRFGNLTLASRDGSGGGWDFPRMPSGSTERQE